MKSPSPIANFGTQTRPKKKKNQAFYFPCLSPPSLPVLVAAVRVSPCHSRQPSIISDASALEGDRSSTPSDINSPRHRTHSLCNVRAAHCTLPPPPTPPNPQCFGCSPCLPQPVMLSLCNSRFCVAERVHEQQRSQRHFLPASAPPALHLVHLTHPAVSLLLPTVPRRSGGGEA